MKLHSCKSRISVEICGATFVFAPLSKEQKDEIMLLSTRDALSGIRMTLQYGLKDIKGCTDENDNELKLEFDDNGLVKKEFIDMICNPEDSDDLVEKISHTCMNFLKGVPNKIIDLNTKKEIEGVKILHPTNKGQNNQQ